VPSGTPAPAQAQRPTTAGAKLPAAVIGVVDMGIISRDGAAYKSLRAQIESQSKAWDAELKKKNDDLRKLEDDFRKQAATLTPEQITEKRKQFDTQLNEFQRQINVRRRQLAEGEAQSTQPIEAALNEIFQQIAIERGINVVIYRNATLLFATELDITADALQRLNAKLPRVTLKLPPPQAATPTPASAPATPPKSN
jgi:outer membrane protein